MSFFFFNFHYLMHYICAKTGRTKPKERKNMKFLHTQKRNERRKYAKMGVLDVKMV